MKIEWMILGEGIAQDARGAITVVGLNQNVLAIDNFPTQTKRAVILRLTGVETGENLHFTFSVTSPSGRVVAAQQGQASIGGAMFPELPTALDIPLEFVITVSEEGRYRFNAEVTSVETEETKASSVSLFVVPPKA